MTDQLKASSNKFLRVRPDVVLTEITEPVVCALDPFFGEKEHYGWVTSGKRDVEKQLAIIKNYAHLKTVDKEFPDVLGVGLYDKVTYGPKEMEVFAWQPAWSRLLQDGVMISPPITCAALFDYVHPTKGLITAGTVRPASEHFCEGPIHCFDIGGASGLKEEIIIVTGAKQQIPAIVDFLIEHENDALHIRCVASGPV